MSRYYRARFAKWLRHTWQWAAFALVAVLAIWAVAGMNEVGTPVTHRWYWKPRMWERSRKGMLCRVLVRGGKNSILVEMEDGELVVCCRYAVRQEKAA